MSHHYVKRTLISSEARLLRSECFSERGISLRFFWKLPVKEAKAISRGLFQGAFDERQATLGLFAH